MTKVFCDCCESELSLTPERMIEGSSVRFDNERLMGNSGVFTFDITVAHTGGGGESPSPDICRKCLLQVLANASRVAWEKNAAG